MASIALSIIGCIDYLAYGTIFMRAMFRPKKKLDVFFPARKAGGEPRRVVVCVSLERARTTDVLNLLILCRSVPA
jgi:hypothetical protein